jgi:putative spermidine/putrescine transport system substrate-binding protein
MFVAGCGSSGSDDKGQELQKLGKGEGELNLIAPAAFVLPPWSDEFERNTGCTIDNRTAGTVGEIAQMMRSGRYDGIAAPSEVSGRLVDEGTVAPVNVSLVPNFKTIFGDLKYAPFNTVEGVQYGIPQGRNANLLIWNTNDVKPAPTSWDVMFDPKKAAKYKGKIGVYDDPIYIADAAVYLKAHQPSLEIESPYELNEEQFEAAVKLLKEQRPYVGEYWYQRIEQISDFENGDSQVGVTWQYQYTGLKAVDEPVATSPASQDFVPEEGATGWSYSWMVSSKAKHPNCMYKWLNWIVSPEVNALTTEISGEAPAQILACSHYETDEFCAKYRAKDSAFWERISYWEAPLTDCGNGSTDCMGYDEWVKAWKSIKEEGPS